MASTIHHHLSQSWLDFSRITLDLNRINISTEKRKHPVSGGDWYKSTEALKSTEPLQATKEMTFLYQGNTDISVWSIFLFSCHVWETTVLGASLRVHGGSQHKTHCHPLTGPTAAGLKNCARSICSASSSASRTLTGISKSAPTKLPAWLVEPQRALSNFKRLNLEQDDRQSPLQHHECVHPSSNAQPSDGSNSHFCLQREQLLFIFKLPLCVTLYEKL